MARPCACNRDGCRLCWLYNNDPRYTKLWDNSKTITKYVVKPGGPGTELKAMLLEIGAKTTHGCGCNDLALTMDRLGVEGCRKEREHIVEKLRGNAAVLNLVEFGRLAVSSLTATWITSIHPFDRYGSLVDEAIRRTEAKQNQAQIDQGAVQGT